MLTKQHQAVPIKRGERKRERDCGGNLNTHEVGRWENKYVLTNLKIVVLAEGLQISRPQWKQVVAYLASPVCF